MTTILVTTDGSDLGQQALAHAHNLAQALGARLTALTVHPDPAPLVGEFAYVPAPTPEEDRAAEEELRAGVERQLPGGTLRVERAGGRTIPRVILDVAAQEQASMIVMSTHGRSGLGRALLGSVAEAVAHHSPVPVLLIRAGQLPTTWTR